jgi:energy-coupling factor transporter transmembrane protein EcfT
MAIPNCNATLGGALIYLINFAKSTPGKFLEVIMPLLAMILAILLVTAFMMGKFVWNPIKKNADDYQELREKVRSKKRGG